MSIDVLPETSKVGYVYILINPSMPGLVKIGRTANRSELRASQLSKATGVPTNFELVYDRHVRDSHKVERWMHNYFAAYRVNRAREFFQIELDEAINALDCIALAYMPGATESRLDVLSDLDTRCRRWLRQDLVRAELVQNHNGVYIETVVQPIVDIDDVITSRYDGIGRLWADGRRMFPSDVRVEVNARALLDLPTAALANLVNIFSDDAIAYFGRLQQQKQPVPFSARPAAPSALAG